MSLQTGQQPQTAGFTADHLEKLGPVQISDSHDKDDDGGGSGDDGGPP